MSPALLNKYLQAAREVGDHMVLTPDGFDFAPHPMLVETDREKYAIQRIVRFLRAPAHRLRGLLPGRVALQVSRRRSESPSATLAAIAAEAKVSAKYLPMIWQILEETPEAAKQEVGPIAKLQAMWRALPAPGKGTPSCARQCVEMRDFVVRIRSHTAMQFAAPVVQRIARRIAAAAELEAARSSIRTAAISTRKALRNDTDPPPEVPEIPKYPGLHQEAAPRWAALTAEGPRRRSRSGGSGGRARAL